MTRTSMAQKLNGLALSSKNNLNAQDRAFLKNVARELMRNMTDQDGKNSVKPTEVNNGRDV